MIVVHHPGTGTTLNLAECVVLDHEPSDTDLLDVRQVGDAKRLSRSSDGRVYLFAVSEDAGYLPSGGTGREVLVLNTVPGREPERLDASGKQVEWFDDVHDLFVDTF